jgi:predicted dehydrogenase
VTLMQYALRALAAGKAVLSEKPLSTHVSHARKALKAAAALRPPPVPPPTWFVAENFRFEDAFSEAARIVPSLGFALKVDLFAEAPMNPMCAPTTRRRNHEYTVHACNLHDCSPCGR